jgi:Na+/melibiose symporter-like transporter
MRPTPVGHVPALPAVRIGSVAAAERRVFSIPSSLSSTGKVVFAYASYLLFQAAYSWVNIPYGSLAAAMTQDPDERAKLST